MTTSTLSISLATATMISRDFILAGRAIFTIEPPLEFCELHGLPRHYTFKISRKSESHPYFAFLLAGPDNESSYQYVGIVNPRHPKALLLTKKSKFTEDTWAVKILRRVLVRILADEGDVIAATGWQVMHEGKCGKCGRLLTDPESIRTGIGPKCAERIF